MLIYVTLLTVFKAIETEVFCRDIMNCGVSIWNMVLKYWMAIMNMVNTISELCNKTPQQVALVIGIQVLYVEVRNVIEVVIKFRRIMGR